MTGAAKPNVHILGGGVGAITAAYWLSSPGWRDRFAGITIHQLGWRLGGKGASGRDSARGNRIEEHGLHVWFGFYENAFRMVHDCHQELDAMHRNKSSDPAAARWPTDHRSVEESFHPVDRVGLMEDFARSWRPWVATFPRRPGLPWDRDLLRDRPTWGPSRMLPDFLVQLVSLGRTVIGSLEGGFLDDRRRSLEAQNAIDGIDRLLGVVAKILDAGGVRAVSAAGTSNGAATRRWLEAVSPALGETLAALDGILDNFGRRFSRLFWWSEEVRRLWAIVDLVLAVTRGLLDDRVFDDDAVDALDDEEFRSWLVRHGATTESVEGPFVRSVVYDLAFAYESGLARRASCAAGTAMRGLHRLLFTYRGALMWKMNGGMGDVVFMPMYELLTKRGVTFEFFRQITNLKVDGRRVTHIEYRQQADPPLDATENLLLADVGEPGRPAFCWRSTPAGSTVEDARKLESNWWRDPKQPRRQLEVGEHDVVVLGIALDALRYVARELIASSERWRSMVEKVRTVPTEALQLWLRPAIAEIGWEPDAIVGGYGKPFDTWSDMPFSLAAEDHGPGGPRSLAYFCSVLDTSGMESLDPAPDAADDVLEKHYTVAWQDAEARLRRDVDEFVRRRLPLLWPGTSATKDAPPKLDIEVDRYERVNIDPTDRYVLSVPGSSRHRLRPDDTGFDNLFVVGDWTECTLNAGCVEAAVMSGMTAARAIGTGESIEIIGERGRRWREQ